MDRFLMRIHLGYPDEAEENEILRRFEQGTDIRPDSPLTQDEIAELKEGVKRVYLADDVRSYISSICRLTRKLDAVELGASPRASLSLALASKAYAFIEGRDFVLPDDVKALAVPVLAHRLVISQDSFIRGISAQDIIMQVLNGVTVPIGDKG
jgi:MoxR-like ATPase